MKKIFLTASIIFTALFGFAQTTELFISEYIEGTSNNRAIEIFNGTGSTVNLSAYRLEKDLNGSNTFPFSYYNLSGLLENGKTYVVCNPSANAQILSKATAIAQVITDFTGNDQIRLLKNMVEIDRIGIPGAINFGQNTTFIRKSSVTAPLPGQQDPRSNGQWDAYPNDYAENLGTHQTSQAIVATYTYDANGNRITATVVYLSKSPSNPNPKIDDQLPIDPQTTLQVSIFPNPTEGLLQVDLNGVTDEQISAPSNAIRVFDTQGRLLFAISPISTSNTVDLSNYNDGTYIMQLFFAGKMRSFKIVKS